MARVAHSDEVTNIYRHRSLDKVRFNSVEARRGHGKGAKRARKYLDAIGEPLAGVFIAGPGCVLMLDPAPMGASPNIIKQRRVRPYELSRENATGQCLYTPGGNETGHRVELRDCTGRADQQRTAPRT
jgi:hypothetical protein